MKRIDDFEDQRRGIVTYELPNGRRVQFDADAVMRYGIHAMARSAGLADPAAGPRLPVIQSGRTIGTVPSDFDPMFIRSKTFLYDPRPGDFRREGDTWIADRMLGPGDLDAIPGFRRDPRPA